MRRLTCLFFSAAYTTQRCVEAVAESMNMPVSVMMNIADHSSMEFVEFRETDVLIVGVPVYGGRIPEMAAHSLRQLNGNGASAVGIVVYGNRDYDDALLELTDLLKKTGFRMLGAGAFIGQHSIFPKVGTGRPDGSDMERLAEFGAECKARLSKDADYGAFQVKGRYPYKKYSGVPLHPECDVAKCNRCGICVKMCPAGAIKAESPEKPDLNKCISCGRCIYVCARKARLYTGLKYSLAAKMFVAGFSKRKEPEWHVAK